LGRLVILLDGHNHETQQHGVGHAKDRVHEAGDVVVLLAPVGRHRALDQEKAPDRSRHEQRNKGQAEYYADRRITSLNPRQF
jgi:hypothetical protein